ncbi:MAG: protein kinase [Pseudomonadota bacterium]
MVRSRIGDRGLARASVGPTQGQTRFARLSAAIASPLGVLTLLPTLVALIGLVLTLVGQHALRDSNLSMASDRINEEAALLARSIGIALEQSDPILDRLGMLAREHDPTQPLVATAHSLRDLMQGRPGVSYISVSFPDGTFQGAYRDDKDGAIRFQDSRVTPQGTVVKRFTPVGHDRLDTYLEERTSYDPRTRPFYPLAVSAGRRVWTKPYPFFKTHYTGITRAEPIYLSGQLHAVITVDFDVSALSAILSKIALGGATALLYAQDGTLLAYPRGEAAIGRLPLGQDRPLSYGDLNDPLLNAFFSQLARGAGRANELSRIHVNDASLLVARKAVSAAPELPWSVATFLPEEQVLGVLHRHQWRSFLAASAATILASLLSWLFARHILLTRNEIAVARAVADDAVARAQELGSYRLLKMLGKGGMGEVWRAEHRLLVRQAAIKLISLETGSGVNVAQAQERFRREAQSLATLRSRNTIELFDYGVTADGTCFYVMELLDGMDLETLLDKHGPQPAARVIQFLIQACNSLAEAHDAGLVHRDIKPANLYVCRVADEVDVLKVLDFGLVRAASHSANQQGQSEHSSGTRAAVNEAATADATSGDDNARITQVGQAMGTPAYMAPEQALGYELDGRSDLYALGCVGFFLLTGRLVFERHGSLPQMMAHITEPPPDLSALTSNYVPAELALLLKQCLAKKPAQRPAHARALGEALKAIALPPVEQWTEARAQAWWLAHCPKPPSTLAPSAAAQLSVA